MAPMNVCEFLARVFSLTGGGKKFRTRAGGLGLQSIVMELLINCACKRSKVNSRSWQAVAWIRYMATWHTWVFGNLMSSSALGGSKKWGTEAGGCGVEWFLPEIVSTYAWNCSMVISQSLQNIHIFGSADVPIHGENCFYSPDLTTFLYLWNFAKPKRMVHC